MIVDLEMQFTNLQWTEKEEKIAQAAFEKAHQREIAALVQEVRQRAETISKVEDLWKLHDFLSVRRHEIDGKYEYQDLALIFVFAQLVKEGWLEFSELEGIDLEKQTKIAALSRM